MKRQHAYRCALLTAVSFTGLTAIAEAQTGDEPDRQLETVVVTAQKRAQDLQEVGLTIHAFDGDDARILRINEGQDVGDAIAGVHVYNFMGSQPMFVIRGVGVQSFTPNLAPAAASYVDEVYYGSNILTGFSVFDIAGVEVLKGPQGTLFGRNTTAGAVSYRTNRPTRTPEAYLDVGVGNYLTAEGEFAVSGPLGGNAAFRLSGRGASQGEGFYTNRWTPAEAALPDNLSSRYFNPEKDIGEWAAFALRGQLMIEPSADTELLFSMHGSRKFGEMQPLEERGFPPGCDPDQYVPLECPGPFGYVDTDGDPYLVNVDFVGDNEETLVGGMFRLDHEFGDIALTSITAYDRGVKTHYNDTDGSPDLELNQVRDVTVEQWSEELRLTGTHGNLFWVTGAYLGSERVKQDFCGDVNTALGLTNFFDPDFAGRAASGCRLRWWQATTSAALYGHSEWGIADRLTLIGGLRYTHEKKDFRAISEWIYNDGQLPLTTIVNFDADPTQAATTDDSETFSNLSGKVGLNYQAMDDLLVYASYSRGYKSGGFDGEFAFVRNQLLPYEEETLTAYEAGWKMAAARAGLTLNGAVFYYDFHKPQLVSQATTSVGVPFNRLVNVDSAELYGADLDFDWTASDQLSFRLGLNVTTSEISDPQRPEFDGNELPLTSDYSATFGAAYEMPLSAERSITAQVNGKYASPYYLQPDNLGFLEQDARTVLNASLTLAQEDDWEISLWGKNLTDETWVIQSFALFSAFAVTYNDPVTFGATFRRSW